MPGFQDVVLGRGLLDLAFLIHHMLTGNWIVLLLFQLVRSGALVLVSGVKVTSASG